MPRYLQLALCAVLASMAVLAGCSGPTESVTEEPPRELVRVSGSGTCTPLLRLLSDAYDGDGVEWRFLPGLHTGGGVTGVGSGELEIGATSRNLTDEEIALGLTYTVLSHDGIVIAVHPSVTIDGLTTTQVRDIYSGVYANWSELGGPDLPITILDRNEDESAKIIMRRYVLGEDLAISPKAVSLYYETDIIDGLQSTAGAIGYFSLGYGVSNEVPVKFLALDGVAATVENINNGTYAVLRPLGIVTQPDAAPEITEFVTWATSAEARELMESSGYAAAR